MGNAERVAQIFPSVSKKEKAQAATPKLPTLVGLGNPILTASNDGAAAAPP
jgi:hypothetical protein